MPAARMTWLRAALRAMVKLPRSESVPGRSRRVGDGGAQCLVGDKQGVDFLLDAVRGAAPTAERIA
jgi:hypothetical protein